MSAAGADSKHAVPASVKPLHLKTPSDQPPPIIQSTAAADSKSAAPPPPTKPTTKPAAPASTASAAADGAVPFWAVLVGGDAPGATHHGSHVSIDYIGRAYSVLKRRLGSRDRIIVIAQVREVADWYATKADMKKQLWIDKKKNFDATCGELLADGGADYDGTDVNPATVIRVLKGITGPRYVQ